MLTILKNLFKKQTKELSEFEKSNPLGFGGERVDFIYDNFFNYSKLDMYQKNHYRRYEFATKIISNGNTCGDFACGAGYGTVMLSKNCAKIVGIDINKTVIREISKRYKKIQNLNFKCCDLLNINMNEELDYITSFETIEHFPEKDILILLQKFNEALKMKGKILFSTPFMQEESEAAIKMGFHKTFNINEDKIKLWLNKTNFVNPFFYYQDYIDHEITISKRNPDFVICITDKA